MTVPAELVLVRQDDVLAYAGPVCAYPTGFVFYVTISLNRVLAGDRGIGFHGRTVEERASQTRLQVRSGGQILDSAACMAGRTAGQPLLRFCGGISPGSTGHGYYRHMSLWWVSPLPPAGQVEFAIYLQGAPRQSGAVQMDASPIISAARQSAIVLGQPANGSP